MMMMEPTKSSDNQSDRTRECKEALKPGFEYLAEQALSVGWDRNEVALALSELGEQLLQQTAETAGSEADIAIAKALFEIRKSLLTSH
jgi:hypothetical protein